VDKLILGLVVFFGVHAISLLALGWRDRMVERVGLRDWRRYYSIAAAVGLYLLIAGYGAARGEDRVLYVTPAAFRYLAAILMLPAFTLALASVFRGRISARAKHPLLVATMLWSVAHVLDRRDGCERVAVRQFPRVVRGLSGYPSIIGRSARRSPCRRRLPTTSSS
jgi:uncharacterized membrane protein